MSPGNRAADMAVETALLQIEHNSVQDPYRTPADLSKETPVIVCRKESRYPVGDGYVIRATPCPLPSWWDRLWGGVKNGDIWQCDRCKRLWKWIGYNSCWESQGE